MKKIITLIVFCLVIPNIVLAQVRRSLGTPVNTEQFTEYAPSISADNNLLIFETDRGPNGKWELYYSTKNDKKKWLAPKPILPINSQGKDNDLIGGPSISYDGKTLYFFASFDTGKGDMDLYSSNWDGKDWTTPVSLGDNINTARYEGFPSISADGKRLFFIRDNFIKRKDKETCYTIWMSNKQEDGSWGLAEKLPAPVNMDCEKSPRIMADGRTLIFSSVRKDGVGSFDLYQSIQEDDGSWTAPENLEYINTEEADQFASVSATGDLMYYQHTGDIYTVTIPDKYRKYKLLTLSGVIQDAITKKPIKTKLTIKSSNPKERPNISAIGEDGKFIVVLRVGTKYNFIVNYPEYLPYNGTVDLTQAKENTEITQNVELVPTKLPFQFQLLDKETKAILKDPKVRIMETETKTPVVVTVEGDLAKADLKMNVAYKFSAGAAGYGFFARPFKPDSSDAYKDRTKRIPLVALKKDMVVQLNDITFETAKAELKPDSFEELDRLIKMLEDSPNVKCEISAHTDDVGNDDYNLKLSDKRAKSVVDYLANKGIKTERMIPKGYGETQPLVANDTDENKAKNRRVQFKIVN